MLHDYLGGGYFDLGSFKRPPLHLFLTYIGAAHHKNDDQTV